MTRQGANCDGLFPFASLNRRRALIGATTALAGVRWRALGAQSPEATLSSAQISIRPNAKSLDAGQKSAFVDAVLALKLKPSPWIDGLNTYDTFVLWHRDAFDCQLGSAHMGPAFFPWHRQYLLLFEAQLQSVDPSVVLPYWDWTIDSAPDSYLWQDDLMGGNGDKANGEAVVTGPFQQGKWMLSIFDYGDSNRLPYVSRDFGAASIAETLPTLDQVEAALSVSTYDADPWNALSPIASSFRNSLEGWRDCVDQMCDPVDGIGPMCTGIHELHNRVHLWVSGEFAFTHEMNAASSGTPAPADEIFGTMAANSSPNDPVFFLHHCNIDRIFNLWLARHGPNYLPISGGPVGHNIDDAMWPYHQIGLNVTPRMMLDSRPLGYTYDTDETN